MLDLKNLDSDSVGYDTATITSSSLTEYTDLPHMLYEGLILKFSTSLVDTIIITSVTVGPYTPNRNIENLDLPQF